MDKKIIKSSAISIALKFWNNATIFIICSLRLPDLITPKSLDESGCINLKGAFELILHFAIVILGSLGESKIAPLMLSNDMMELLLTMSHL